MSPTSSTTLALVPGTHHAPGTGANTGADTTPAASGQPCTFYLGTHQPHWLWQTTIPLFVSHRQLTRRRSLHPATCRWALDSGGFTALALDGRYIMTPGQYADTVDDYATRIGNLDFAAPMDWMCEPAMTDRTGLTIAEHQYRTVTNYLELRELAPHLPFIPVLQGWHLADYLTCADLYQSAGIDLAAQPRVGIGSICRRQATAPIAAIITTLAARGLRLHGFGVKTGGLTIYGHQLASADSMAWSYSARRSPALLGCTGHKNCANCITYATQWRHRIITRYLTGNYQPTLFDDQPAGTVQAS